MLGIVFPSLRICIDESWYWRRTVTGDVRFCASPEHLIAARRYGNAQVRNTCYSIQYHVQV